MEEQIGSGLWSIIALDRRSFERLVPRTHIGPSESLTKRMIARNLKVSGCSVSMAVTDCRRGSHEGSSVAEGDIRQKIHHDSNLIRVAQIALSYSLIGNSRGSVSSRLTSVVNCSRSCFAKAAQIFSASSYSFRASAILFWSLSRIPRLLSVIAT
jgi:hypothetical protein